MTQQRIEQLSSLSLVSFIISIISCGYGNLFVWFLVINLYYYYFVYDSCYGIYLRVCVYVTVAIVLTFVYVTVAIVLTFVCV